MEQIALKDNEIIIGGKHMFNYVAAVWTIVTINKSPDVILIAYADRLIKAKELRDGLVRLGMRCVNEKTEEGSSRIHMMI